jgi:ElaB/YqjD/DUF883 family membrane-anchored ribosome-binding protein
MFNIASESDKKSASSVEEDLRRAANQAGRKVREFVDTATHEVMDTSEKVETQIRSHPLAATAAAAGIGFLLGALFRRC